MAKAIKTLQQAIIHFSDAENCREFMANLRWPDGKPKCPVCGSENVSYLPNAKVYKCFAKPAHDKVKFSLKVGTIFEESPIGLEKWLPVMWLIVNCKNGVSSWEIHRAIGVTQKTAWFMLQRARLAMQDDLTGGMLGGEVEVDETFIGGKARNMHKDRKERIKNGRRHAGPLDNKTIVLGILQRETEGKPKTVRATVISERSKPTMQAEVGAHVAPGSNVYTDEHGYHWGKGDPFIHQMVNHLENYVDGQVHTNGLENFWSLLKRCVGGTYVSVEPFHLFRYIDEQAFRFNNRKDMKDDDRFIEVMKHAVGKRLTYAELTGKMEDGPTPTEEAF
jgi:transposase-like protein